MKNIIEQFIQAANQMSGEEYRNFVEEFDNQPMNVKLLLEIARFISYRSRAFVEGNISSVNATKDSIVEYLDKIPVISPAEKRIFEAIVSRKPIEEIRRIALANSVFHDDRGNLKPGVVVLD